jgi:hypothetical protein
MCKTILFTGRSMFTSVGWHKQAGAYHYYRIIIIIIIRIFLIIRIILCIIIIIIIIIILCIMMINIWVAQAGGRGAANATHDGDAAVRGCACKRRGPCGVARPPAAARNGRPRHQRAV